MVTAKGPARQSLAVELHAETRNEHANLNRTIIARLPLCLPSATSTPALYAQGITVFGQIYYGFEEAWDFLLAEENISQKHRIMLTRLHIPQLRRKQRLDVGLRQLSTKSRQVSGPLLSELQTMTSHFRNEIMQSIISKPHLLAAYTWTMYLALFNGGRWIAKQLLNAGTLFWDEDDREMVTKGSLSFWFFGDDESYDGEDLKIAFKDRFNDVAESLTDQERDEIIAESRKLFQLCTDMVTFLDEHAQATKPERTAQTNSNQESAKELQSNITVLRYLASFTPFPVVSIWRSFVNNIPATSSPLLVLRRPEVDQKHR